MSHPDIDSWISKALLLLQSNSEESAEELRTMLTEAIHQKYNGRKSYRPIPNIVGTLSESNQKHKSKDIHSKSFLSELKQKSPSSPVTPDSCLSDSESSSENSEDMCMEILEADLACAVCRQINFRAWNRLVECAECHSLYHQECHNPPISEMDGSDPRVVWYCRNCNKNVSKPKTSASSNSNSSQSSKSSSSSTSSSSGSTKQQSSSAARASNSSPSFGNKQFGGQVTTSLAAPTNSAPVHRYRGVQTPLKWVRRGWTTYSRIPEVITFPAGMTREVATLTTGQYTTPLAVPPPYSTDSGRTVRCQTPLKWIRHGWSTYSRISEVVAFPAGMTRDVATQTLEYPSSNKKLSGPSKSNNSSSKCNINISSADRRLQIMKKKAAKKHGPSHSSKIIK